MEGSSLRWWYRWRSPHYLADGCLPRDKNVSSATCPATHGVLWFARYHSAVLPFSPWSYPMFWMRLSTGNSSRRVRRYWALILHVKHWGLPVHQLARSHESRDRSIAQPQGVQMARVSQRCDWSGRGSVLGLL
jgi:hypothetical protein